jgi:hypothetical protein
MSDRFDLSLILGAGVVTEILLLSLAGFRLGRIVRLALAVAVGVAGFAVGRALQPDLMHVQVLAAVSAFALAAFLLLKNEILPRVSESSLLIGTIVLWYLFANLDAPPEVVYVLAGLAVLPTLGTVVVAALVRDWGYRARQLLYVWFLVQSAAMSVMLLRFGDLEFVIHDQFTPPNLVSLLATGMGVTYLAACLFYIWMLIPIFRHGRLEDWWGDARLMAASFSDYEMTLPQAIVIAAVIGAIFLANEQLRLVPVELLASAVLVMQRFGSRLLRPNQGTELPVPAPAGS